MSDLESLEITPKANLYPKIEDSIIKDNPYKPFRQNFPFIQPDIEPREQKEEKESSKQQTNTEEQNLLGSFLIPRHKNEPTYETPNQSTYLRPFQHNLPPISDKKMSLEDIPTTESVMLTVPSKPRSQGKKLSVEFSDRNAEEETKSENEMEMQASPKGNMDTSGQDTMYRRNINQGVSQMTLYQESRALRELPAAQDDVKLDEEEENEEIPVTTTPKESDQFELKTEKRQEGTLFHTQMGLENKKNNYDSWDDEFKRLPPSPQITFKKEPTEVPPLGMEEVSSPGNNNLVLRKGDSFELKEYKQEPPSSSKSASTREETKISEPLVSLLNDFAPGDLVYMHDTPRRSITCIADKFDFEVNITDTRDVSDNNLIAYTTYHIVTILKSEEKKEELDVWRRYSQFDNLYNKLAKKYSGLMVPVLPQKTVFAKLAFEKDHIVLSRKRELIRFIRKCLEHPILRKSPELHDFIGNKLDEDAEVIDDFPHDDGWGIEKIYNLVSKSFYGSKPRHTTEKDHQIMNFQAKIHETLTIVQSLKDRLQSLQNDNDKKLELTSKFLNDVQSITDKKRTHFPFIERSLVPLTTSIISKPDSERARTVRDLLDCFLPDLIADLESALAAIHRRNECFEKLCDTEDRLKAKQVENKKKSNSHDEVASLENNVKNLTKKYEQTTRDLLAELEKFEVKCSLKVKELFEIIQKVNLKYYKDISEVWVHAVQRK